MDSPCSLPPCCASWSPPNWTVATAGVSRWHPYGVPRSGQKIASDLVRSPGWIVAVELKALRTSGSDERASNMDSSWDDRSG